MIVLDLNVCLFSAKKIKFVQINSEVPLYEVVAEFTEEEWNKTDYCKLDNEQNALMFREIRLIRVLPNQEVEVLLFNKDRYGNKI
jgi:hypothetical protein